MLKNITLILVFVSAFLSATDARSMSQRLYTDDQKAHAKALYMSCKEAVEKNYPEKKFSATICYAHISGIMESLSTLGMMYAFSPTLSPCWDKTALTRAPENFCFPQTVSHMDYAKRYVEYVDKINGKRSEHDIFLPFPGEVLNILYSCQKDDE